MDFLCLLEQTKLTISQIENLSKFLFEQREQLIKMCNRHKPGPNESRADWSKRVYEHYTNTYRAEVNMPSRMQIISCFELVGGNPEL